jgi:hypothetical protein
MAGSAPTSTAHSPETQSIAAFMGGLALGAWLAGRWLARANPENVANPASLLWFYSALEIAIAVVALLLPLALRTSVPVLAWAYADGEAPARLALVRVAISLLLVGIPATAMGATYPLAADWLDHAR